MILEVSFARYSDKSERNRRFVINLLSICKGMLGATSHIGHPDLLQNEVLLLIIGFVKGLLLRSFSNAFSGLTKALLLSLMS